MISLRAGFNRLPPKARQAVLLGGVFIPIAVFVWVIVPGDDGARLAARRQDKVGNLVVDSNTRNLGLDGLEGQFRNLRRDYEQLESHQREQAQQSQQLLADIVQQMRRAGEQAGAADQTRWKSAMSEMDKRVAGLTVKPSDKAGERQDGTTGSPNTPPRSAELEPPAPPAAAPAAPMAPPVSPVAFSNKPVLTEEPTGRSPVGDLSAAAVFAKPPEQARVGAPIGKPPGSAPLNRGFHYVTSSVPVEQSNRSIPPAKGSDRERIPAGAILTGTILTGLDAPTGQAARKDPFPALLRLKEVAILPNRFKADVRECFLLVAGFGDLSSERAYMRAEKVSCVKNDGSVIEEKIEGYVADESGKAGIRGRVVSKQGAFIARALITGIMQGIAQAFSQSTPLTFSTSPGGVIGTSPISLGSQAESGLGNGVGLALDRIAQFYLDQAGAMFPVIEISAGREVDVVLTGGISMQLPN